MSTATLTINNPGTMLKSLVLNDEQKRQQKTEYTISVLSRISAVIKQVCAVSNRMVWYLQQEALYDMQQIPQCSGRVAQSFRKARTMYDNYEKNLRYAKENRFFHLADMDEETRAKYRADLTDGEYFQMWLNVGDNGYNYYKKELKVMMYKFERVLRNHGVDYPKPKSKLYMWYTLLNISCSVYKSLLENIESISGVEYKLLDSVFRGFCLRPVFDQVEKSIVLMEDVCHQSMQMTDDELHDLQLSKHQFERQLMDVSTGMDAVAEAIERHSDVFVNKRTFRQVYENCMELDNDITEECEELKKKYAK